MNEQNAFPEPVLFINAEEFCGRPAYTSELRCNGSELSHLIGKYDLPKDQYIKCGLNGCKKLHGHGYVFAKHTGEESHCGIDCGKNVFDLKWKEVLARFRNDQKASDTRKHLQNIQIEASEIVGYADRYTADCTLACSLMRDLVEKLFTPAPELLRHLISCAKNGGKIQVANYSAKRLGKDLGHRNRGADLETIGILKGASALLARDDVLPNMSRAVKSTRVLATLDVATLSKEELSYHSRKFQEAREALQATGLFLQEARRLLRRENLEELKKFRRLFPDNQGGMIVRMLNAIDLYCAHAPEDPLSPKKGR